MTEIEIILLFCSFSLWFVVFFVVLNTVHIMRQRRRINAEIKQSPHPDHAQYMALLAGAVARSRRTPPPLPTDNVVDLPRFLK